MALKRLHEENQLVTVMLGEGLVLVLYLLGLTAMPEDGLFDALGSAIVEIGLIAIDHQGEAYAPERSRTPLLAIG